MRQLICRPFFPHLERALLDDLRAAPRKNPLEPRWVLVPSRNLRQSLRRKLADEGVPTFNVRFVLFPELADAVLAAGPPEGSAPPPRLIDGVADALIVRGVVEGLPAGEGAYFEGVAVSAGFHRALLRTLGDLDEACVAPERLALLAREAPPGVNAPKMAELARLAAARRRRLAERGVETRALRIARAAGPAARLPDAGPLSVYGFYDLTGVQRRLLTALFAGREVRFYLPLVRGAGSSYAAPVRAWLAAQEFQADDGAAGWEAAGAGSPAAAPAGDTPADPRAAPAPALEWFSAAGEQREVEECVRRVLALLAGGGLSPDRIAVLYRTPDPYAGMLRRAFDRAGIPAVHSEAPALAETRPARALRLLIEAARSGLGRREVLDFLDIVVPDLSRIQVADRVALVAAWDGLTREAGIVKGRLQWETRLIRRRVDHGRDGREREALEVLKQELPALFAFMEGLGRERTWSGLADRLGREIPDWLPPDPAQAALLEAVARLADLDLTGEPADLPRLAEALDEMLRRTLFGAGRPAQAAVFVGDVMPARGLSFDRVFLLGMTEGVFPRSAGQDPMLLDAERRCLAADAEWLPLRRAALDEDALLFELVTGAAPALTLSWARTDPATARPRLPSGLLLRAVSQGLGRPADYETLDCLGARIPLDLLDAARLAGAREPGQAVPAVPERFLDARLALDGAEFDRLLSAAAVGAGRIERLAALRGEPAFRRALDAEEARGTRFLTRYDGLIESEAGRAALGRLQQDGCVLSASRLERYAACPFAYFLDSVLGVTLEEAPEEMTAIAPTDRGKLVHDILRDFLSEPDRRPRKDRRKELHEALGALARARFRDFEAGGVMGHRLLWVVEQRRLLDDLASWLDFEIDRGDGLAPVELEVPFGMTPPASGGQVRLELPGGGDVFFRGRIDRVDADESAAARVVDYKTGRVPDKLKMIEDLDGGRRLQLAVYLLALDRLHPLWKPVAAEYLHLRGGPSPVPMSDELLRGALPELARVTEVLVSGMEAGIFMARPDANDCSRCPHLPACGVDRDARLRRKWNDPRVRALIDLDATGEAP